MRSFDKALNIILTESPLHRNPTNVGRGSETFTGYIPAEFASDEPEVEIEFDWETPEPRTRDYPGSPGGVYITKVTTMGGKELNTDTLPDSLQNHFEELAIDHLDKRDNRAMADHEDSIDARREEPIERR